MPALLELQRIFGAAMLAPASAVSTRCGIDPLLLSIYQNTCHSTLTNALALSYPAVKRLVGPDFFEAMAREFFSACPPSGGSLHDYGEGFAVFAAQYAPARPVPYLSDVARLEWAVTRALHAEDVPPMAVGALSGLDPAQVPQLRFVPHPAVTLLDLTTPADAIWRAVLDNDEAAMRAVDLERRPLWLLVDRTAAEGVRVRRVARHLARFTRLLLTGEALQVALDALGPAAGVGLETVLADHLASGRLVGWSTSERCSIAASPTGGGAGSALS